MPSLGADMEAGTLVEWLIKPGDQVKRGDIVAVVETQKGAIEIEIFETGTVERILVEIGTKVPIGTPLAIMQTQRENEGGGPHRLLLPSHRHPLRPKLLRLLRSRRRKSAWREGRGFHQPPGASRSSTESIF